MKVRRLSFLAIAGCCLAGLSFSRPAPAAAQEPEPGPPGLNAWVARALDTFEVPGVAVTIVKDGEVVLARGYGERTIEGGLPVDGHTRFGIASNTKAFTATALGLLVEDGKLEWDGRVIDYLPWFRMWDPWVTREMTIRDLLVHRSGLGLGQGDLLYWPESDVTRREIVEAIRYLEPATSFRSAYAYDNILYHAAALVIEEVSGMTWEDFVQSRILDALGMTDTRVSRASTLDEGNVATPHARVEGVVRPVKPLAATATNAAGGINSTAADMAKWLVVQLDSGRVAGAERLFTPATTRQLWGPVTPMPIGRWPESLGPWQPQWQAYALGFVVRDYRGHKLITHTGGLPGYVSRVAMIPDLRLGVAVLTNQEAGAAFDAITLRILDHYLGAEPRDWIGVYADLGARRDSVVAARDMSQAAARDTAAHPSLPPAGYAGTYHDDWYGDVEVRVEGEGLVIQFGRTPSLLGDLEPWQFDTFYVRWRDRELRADALITFELGVDGKVERARMKPASPSVDFSYDFQDLDLRRVPAEE
jgi:CubicO group peptidase (beta-lactamase class C family)